MADQVALEKRLAQIDAAEKLAVEAPRHEVYVGFHELESLLPQPTVDPPAAPAAPAATAAPPPSPPASSK